MKTVKYTFNCLIILLGILVISPAVLQAQTEGRIRGIVTDSNTGTGLPGVNILIEGTNLGASSDIDGFYYINNVPVGEYEVKAVYVGYKTVTKTDVIVSLDRTVDLDFDLEESIIEGETIVVLAERDLINKEVSSSQQVISTAQLANAAGIKTINEFLGAQAGIGDERKLTIRGGSAEQTGSFVNGLSFVNQRIGKAEATIPLSAIEQISLNTGGYGAEYGNFRSGIINIVTKSGERDRFHGAINASMNKAEMKRFGKSLYDPTNYYLQPYFDPILAFEGTSDETWAKVTGSAEEGAYQNQGHAQFRGWDDLVDRYNRGLPVEQQATAMDLYLYNAWMHMIVPDFDKLEELYPEYEITEAQKQALRDHAHEKEGEHADYDLDIGFGGPLPFIGKSIGDATFYLSHKTTNYNYVQPVMRDGERISTTMLSLKSNITRDLTIKVHGLYRFIRGTQSNFPTDGDIPDINQGGDTMPINNLASLLGFAPDAGSAQGGVAYGDWLSQYAYHPTFWQPKDQSAWLTGVTLNNVISPETFWDLTVSYAYQQDLFEPKETRNHAAIINFGPFWVNEMPYGINFGPDTVFYDPNDHTKFFAPGEYENAYQIPRRHASKVGQFHENSVTQQFRFKFDLRTQINRYNFVNTGVEFNYFDINNDNWRWWEGHDTIYEMRDKRKPYQLGVYVQDQISLKGMEAKLGVRFDYYNSGGGVWPSGDVYNEEAFTRGTEADDINKLYDDLKSGKTVVWDRWRAIDEAMGGTFLEKTKNHITISPRLGIAFPITERAKFYFNYGHFRQPVPYSEQFFYKMRFFKQGIFELGNPNLAPPRTISYELGVSYNLLDQFLIEASTYYKDVSGEAARVNYLNDGSTVDIDSWLNNRWEDDQGLELKITKSWGTFVTGWINFWYVIDKNGRVGSNTVNEDEQLNTETSYYASDQNNEENRPTLSPKLAANLSFHTPAEFGPKAIGFYPLDLWTLNILPVWERGTTFTYNPQGVRNVDDNLRWPDYYKVDLKLSKSIEISGVMATLYLDVRNVFNNKINWMEHGWAFSSLDDRNRYLASLHLPEYSDKSIYPEEYVAGDDRIGDLRSADKPYIDDPNVNMFLFGYPREFWFGCKIDF